MQSIRFFYQGQDLRIAYTFLQNEIIFLLIDQRENFYEKLKKQI